LKEVFRTVSEPSELTRWFLANADIVPEHGRRYEFTWQGGYRHAGKVLEFVRNRKLSIDSPGPGNGKTRLTFSVRRDGTRTLLEVRHSGYRKATDAWLEMYGGTESGWAYFLLNLKSLLEHGHDLRSSRDAV
jgi:uncharacterized protein YndB with AHSA1/START domain